MLTLVGETADLALGLLEKNGGLIPFCRARKVDQEILLIMADSDSTQDDNAELTEGDFERSVASIWIELKKQISVGEIQEFAFCADKTVKFQNEPDHRRVLQIEFQNGTEESAIYFFPLSIENGHAQVSPKYLCADVREKLL